MASTTHNFDLHSTAVGPMTSTYTAPMTQAATMPTTTFVEPVLPSSASMIATPAYLPSSASMIATPSYGGYGGYSALEGPFKFHATPQAQTATQTMAAPTATMSRPTGTVVQQPVSTVQTTTRH